MIDNFAIALTHSLMVIAAWRLLTRADLDDENATSTRSLWRRRGTPPDA